MLQDKYYLVVYHKRWKEKLLLVDTYTVCSHCGIKRKRDVLTTNESLFSKQELWNEFTTQIDTIKYNITA